MTSSMRRVMAGVVALGLGAGVASAATIAWTNVAGGTFSDATNWEGGVPPAEGDLALFTNTATYTVSFNQPATNGEARFSASSGLVTLNLGGQVWRQTNLTYFGYTAGADARVRAENGELETKALQLGNISATAAGALTVAGATATVFGSSGLGIGMSGTGRVVVATDDAILRVTGGGTHLVGNSAGSLGALLVSNGFLSVSGALTVGSSGQGDFQMNQSTGLISGSLLLGSTAGAQGRFTMVNAGADLSVAGLRLGVSAGAQGEMYVSNGVLRTQGENKVGEDGSGLLVMAGGTWLAATSGAINANLYVPFAAGTGRLMLVSADAKLVQTGNGSTIQLSNGTNGFGDLIVSNGMLDVNGIEIADGRATRAEMYVYNATCVVNRTGASSLNVGDQSYSTGLLVVADSRALIVATNGTGIALGGQTANPGNSNAYGRVELSNGTLWVRGFRMAYGADSSADATIGHGTLVNRTDTGIIVGQGLRSRATLVLAETDSLIDATNTASSSPMIVGNSTGAVGTVIVSNGTMRLSRLVVGNLGQGTLTLENEATVSVTDNIYLPNNGTGTGTGTGLLVLASADATLAATSGTISVGASWSGAKSAVGQLIVSNGTVRTRILNVGMASDGLLTVLDGSILQGSVSSAEGLKIGASSEAGTGTVVLAHANALVSLPSNTLGFCTAANASGRLIISNGAVVVLGVQMGGTAATHTNSASEINIEDGSLATIQGAFQCGVGDRTTARVVLQQGNSRLMHTNGTINLGSGAFSRGSLVESNGTVWTRSVNMGGNTASSPAGQYGEWIIHNATNLLRGQGPGTAIWMAGQPNCTGLMVMAHAGAYVDTTNNVLVGDLGDGTLLMSNGLLVAANITMSSQTGSVGRMEMAGGRVAVGGTLVVGNRSTARVNMTGGELSATSLVLVGATTATNVEATLELSGGTLQVARVSAFAAVGARSNFWWSGGTMAALANFTNALGLTLTNSPGPGLATLDSAGLHGPAVRPNDRTWRPGQGRGRPVDAE
jgi:T5SS/PEP-CTERM-associated repeat protein